MSSHKLDLGDMVFCEGYPCTITGLGEDEKGKFYRLIYRHNLALDPVIVYEKDMKMESLIDLIGELPKRLKS